MKLPVVVTVLASAGLVWLVMRRQNQKAQAEAELWAEATDAIG